jgi:hypothetical protein
VGLEGYGLKVTGREPIQVAPGAHNRAYLATKRSKLGHLLADEADAQAPPRGPVPADTAVQAPQPSIVE